MKHSWLGKLTALAGTFLLLAGCANPALQTEHARTSPQDRISLFPDSSALASISMRVIDQRKGYGVQALEDVEDFSDVRISLNSTRMLKAPRTDVLPRNPSSIYSSPVLTKLPPSNDYRLMVALLKDGEVVGQGGETQIRLESGQTRSVTIIIRATGEFSFFSDDYHIHEEEGIPSLFAETNVTMTAYFPWDQSAIDKPFVTHFTYDLFYDEDTVLVASPSHQVKFTVDEDSELPEGPRLGKTKLTLPDLMDPDYSEALMFARIYGLNKEGNSLVTKDRYFFLHRGAGVTVDFGEKEFGNEPD